MDAVEIDTMEVAPPLNIVQISQNQQPPIKWVGQIIVTLPIGSLHPKTEGSLRPDDAVTY